VTLSGNSISPGSVTARGAKHLDDLAAMAAAGHRARMLYIVQRGDGARLRLAGDLDPAYAAAFARARAAGVEAMALTCRVDAAGIELDRPIPIAEVDGDGSQVVERETEDRSRDTHP
ncbi:MAG: DNA/RNA nuclease SfsA, partial [Pseudomonadota bacterium]